MFLIENLNHQKGHGITCDHSVVNGVMGGSQEWSHADKNCVRYNVLKMCETHCSLSKI